MELARTKSSGEQAWTHSGCHTPWGGDVMKQNATLLFFLYQGFVGNKYSAQVNPTKFISVAHVHIP